MRYETTVTLEIGTDEEELDLEVRGYIEVEPSRSRGWPTTLDGELEVFVGGVWVDAATAGASPRSIEHATEALCDLALEDDSAACVEWDEDR